MNKYKRQRLERREQKKAAKLTLRQSRRDFSWHDKKTRNPYRNTPNSPFRPKTKIQIILILVATVGSAAFLLLHPTFSIQSITINDLTQTSNILIKEKINQYLNNSKIFFLSRNNFFLINEDDLSTKLKNEFPISDITIRKIFPNKLEIHIAEKTSTIVLVNAANFILIGSDGTAIQPPKDIILEEITTSTEAQQSTSTISYKTHTTSKILSEIKNSYQNFPIVLNDSKLVTTSTVLISPQIVQSIISWFEYAKTKKIFTINYFALENKMGEGTIVTDDGWSIKTKFNPESTTNQFIIFESVYHNALNNSAPLQYIDLRFGPRVFWK